MKYIIEFEDEPSMVEAGLRYYQCKQVPYWGLSPEIIKNLTPYIEPDRKAIDLRHARDIENVAKMNYNEGAKDAWEFVSKFMWSLESDEILGMNIAHAVRDMTYQEAKTKYDKWKKEKEQIRVGDEVEICGTIGIVTRVPYLDEERVHYIAKSGTVYCNNAYAEINKTGRHFDEVDTLLKKM